MHPFVAILEEYLVHYWAKTQMKKFSHNIGLNDFGSVVHELKSRGQKWLAQGYILTCAVKDHVSAWEALQSFPVWDMVAFYTLTLLSGLKNNWLSCGLIRIMIMRDCWREGWFSFWLVSAFQELIPKIICCPRSHVLFLNSLKFQ